MTNKHMNNLIYDRDQLEQLQLGIDHGVDISVYENPEYMALQMEWIRKGLEDKIDVSIYASPIYDWFQMEEIYKGLVDSLDVTKYSKSSIPYDRMREIRKGLKRGIDLSLFEIYGAKELRELRLALEDKVHIVKYMVKGYDAEQLEVIRKAIFEGIDIEPYLSKEYRGIALEEIANGLKKNLKVDIYAKISYSWQQMREIREGLEERLDVSMYSSYMYNASQMHEIRLGLEAGLDVTTYRSLMYTAKDMQKMRMKLVEEITGGSSIPMVPGDDGYHEYLFNKSKTGNICFLQDGSVDYKQSFRYALCKNNDVIAIYHEATNGKNGISKNGKVIKAIKGKEKKILSGKGVYYDERYKAYIAAISGWILLDEEKNILEIKPAVFIDGINASDNSFTMSGNVEISGNIETGSEIKVDGDLIVNGHVEDVKIECSGNLIIRGGINGNRNAVINVGKSLVSMYIENCSVYAVEDVRADYIYSSKVETKGKVIVAGSKGSIIGSSITAGLGISCDKAGNDVKTKTELVIEIPAEIDIKDKQLREGRYKVLKELEVLFQAREKFRKKTTAEERNTNPNYLKLENAIYTKKLELEKLDKLYNQLLEQKKEYQGVGISVNTKSYEGVTFRIDKVKYDALEEKGPLLVENSNGRICVTKG